eukprot:m.1140556 g.1140556  ORF g.1140556 m.1140556 type:complete len:57 (-) comp24446_c0_seq10:1496-1666(-)
MRAEVGITQDNEFCGRDVSGNYNRVLRGDSVCVRVTELADTCGPLAVTGAVVNPDR